MSVLQTFLLQANATEGIEKPNMNETRYLGMFALLHNFSSKFALLHNIFFSVQMFALP